MKRSSRSRPSSSRLIAFLAVFLGTAGSGWADRWATLAGLNDRMSVEAGETALVVFVPGNSAKLTYQKSGGPAVTLDLDGTNRGSINGNRGQVTVGNPLPLVGPATVILNNSTVVGFKLVATESKASVKTPVESGGSVPSNAVVIPSDLTGPVQILLEASPDLVTWTSAEPGTYGASSTNRFFRVRAVTP